MCSDLNRIIAFNERFAATVLSWVETAKDLANWASINEFPLTDVEIFAKWHSDRDIHPYVLQIAENIVGYGEIWFDNSDHSVEIGRLLIDPRHRNHGYGRRLIWLLLDKIDHDDYRSVEIRLAPGNATAKQCYERAGFKRVSKEIERNYNKAQPRKYIWMSYVLPK